MSEALVNPRLLAWARERAGLPVEVIAKKTGTTKAKAEAWEGGLSKPTFRQATLWADVTHVPLGYLFLEVPPAEPLPIPDLRTVRSGVTPGENADFVDALRDVQFKMDWYRDHRLERGAEPLSFVGSFGLEASATKVAHDMRRALGVTGAAREQAGTWEEYLRHLVSRAEGLGIWVMRSGVVGNNTHRPLSVDVFRGFAIPDRLVPLVFVNARDARAAQVFTLAHELAHLWVGAAGVSDPFSERIGPHPAPGAEGLCNAIAAEFLVPREDFERAWVAEAGLGPNASRLSTQFRVSRIVIAIRARVLNFVPQEDFDAFLASERRIWVREREDTSGGGDYYRTVRSRSGASFVQAVLGAAASGELLLRDAGRLLDMTPKSLREAYRRQEAAL